MVLFNVFFSYCIIYRSLTSLTIAINIDKSKKLVSSKIVLKFLTSTNCTEIFITSTFSSFKTKYFQGDHLKLFVNCYCYWGHNGTKFVTNRPLCKQNLITKSYSRYSGNISNFDKISTFVKVLRGVSYVDSTLKCPFTSKLNLTLLH